MSYYSMEPTVPPQSAYVANKSVATPHYILIPPDVLNEKVCSVLPGWTGARCWILAAPSSGHCSATAHYLIYLEQGGGCQAPEQESGVESFLFVLDGEASVTIADKPNEIAAGGFAFVPAATPWSVSSNRGACRFLWIRKAYEPYDGPPPQPLVAHERDVEAVHDGRKRTKRLLPTDDLAFDFHMNIVGFEPGSRISFAETHVMEHGLYMLEGVGLYLLNERWHEVGPGTFIWMRSFCPQAYVAAGEGMTRYLLYKNMNRQIKLCG